jgi:hypothetical protein
LKSLNSNWDVCDKSIEYFHKVFLVAFSLGFANYEHSGIKNMSEHGSLPPPKKNDAVYHHIWGGIFWTRPLKMASFSWQLFLQKRLTKIWVWQKPES